MPADASGTSDNEFEGLYGDGAQKLTSDLMSRLGVATLPRPPAPPPPPIDTPPRGGDDGGMEKRIEALEAANLETRDRLARIETRLDSLASKADISGLKGDLSSLKGELLAAMAQTETRMIKWFIGTAVVLAGVAFTAAKMLH